MQTVFTHEYGYAIGLGHITTQAYQDCVMWWFDPSKEAPCSHDKWAVADTYSTGEASENAWCSEQPGTVGRISVIGFGVLVLVGLAVAVSRQGPPPAAESSVTTGEGCPQGQHLFGWYHDGGTVCGKRSWGTFPPGQGLAPEPMDNSHDYPAGPYRRTPNGLAWPPCDDDEFERPCYRNDDRIVVFPGWDGYPSTTGSPGRKRPPATMASTTVPTGPNGEPHPGCPHEQDRRVWTSDGPGCQIDIAD